MTDHRLTSLHRPLSSARVAVLLAFLWPQKVRLYELLQHHVGHLQIFLSTAMELNRPWRPEHGHLNVIIQKTLTVATYWRHPLGFRDVNYIHFPLDTFMQLWRYRPSLVIAEQLGFRTLMAALFRLLSTRSRLIIWVHMTEHQQKGKRPFRRVVRRLLLRCADAVIANGQSAKRVICALGYPEPRVFIAHTACDLDAFMAVRRTPCVRSLRRLLYVGRLVEGKGILEFLTRLDAYGRRNPAKRVTFDIFGYGPVERALAALVHPDNVLVRYRGAASLAHLPSAYASADVFVFPTLSDEWGLVVNEAMASGLAVLGSTYSQAVQELVEDGRTGWTFAPDHPDEMDAAIERAIGASDEELEKMGCQARLAVQRVQPECVASAALLAIGTVMNGPDTRPLTDPRNAGTA